MVTLKEKLQLLKTNKKLVYTLSLTLLVALVSFSYYLGVSVGKSRSQKTTAPSNNQVGSNNTIELENELRLCLSNEASIAVSQDDGIYNFSTFKMYSPLLQGKKVSKIEFKYKRALITSRVIDIDESISVKTWVLEKPSQYLSPLPEILSKKESILDLTYSLYDFPILDGYEWSTIVVDEKLVSSRILETPTTSSTYLSSKDIKMYRKTRPCPKSACIAELYFYKTTDQGKTQVFVQILSNISNYLHETDEQLISKNIREAFNNVETFADTLSLEKY